MVDFVFNAGEYDPKFQATGNYLGEGSYLVQNTEIKIEERQDADGNPFQELVFVAECIGCEDPDQLGKICTIQIRTSYPANEKWEKNGREQLSAMTAACEAPVYWTSTDVLLNKPYGVKLVPQKSNPKFMRAETIFDKFGNEPAHKNVAPAATPKVAPKPAAKAAPMKQQAPLANVEVVETAPAPAGTVNGAKGPSWFNKPATH